MSEDRKLCMNSLKNTELEVIRINEHNKYKIYYDVPIILGIFKRLDIPNCNTADWACLFVFFPIFQTVYISNN